MKKNLALTVTDITTSGHGISKNGDMIYSILGTFPGDIVNVRVYKSLKNIHYAEIVSIVKPSIDRIDTPEKKPFFDANAPWKNLSFDAENRYKKQFIHNLYKNTQCYKPSLQHFFAPKQEFGYRNKVAYTFLDTQKGLRFALYTRGSGETKKIEQKENILAHPLIEKVGKQFLNFFNQKRIESEQLKYLILRYSFYENNIVAYLLLPETNRKKLPFKKTELEKFFLQNKDVKGILVVHSEAGLRSAISHKSFYKIGDTDSREKMLNNIYSYDPSLFFQINPIDFMEILKDLRKEMQKIDSLSSFSVLDLFAGVGLIGLEITDLVAEVIGVELSSLSKKYALQNAEQNSISNFNFIEADVDKALSLIKTNQILIVDPTRRGLSQKTIEKIRIEKPMYIFYVSCNPETQYRDFEKIKDIYKITFIKAYNIFPKTQHIESMIVLKKK